MKQTDRFSAKGSHSPETFISHYPEREGVKVGKRKRSKEERIMGKVKQNKLKT